MVRHGSYAEQHELADGDTGMQTSSQKRGLLVIGVLLATTDSHQP